MNQSPLLQVLTQSEFKLMTLLFSMSVSKSLDIFLSTSHFLLAIFFFCNLTSAGKKIRGIFWLKKYYISKNKNVTLLLSRSEWKFQFWFISQNTAELMVSNITFSETWMVGKWATLLLFCCYWPHFSFIADSKQLVGWGITCKETDFNPAVRYGRCHTLPHILTGCILH